MQPRFEQRRGGSAAYALIEQPRFRAGYDFLRLRADAGEVPVELAEWWEDFSLGTAEEREALLAAAREQPQRPRRVPAADDETAEPAAAEAAPARKRRRRRRKPGGGGTAAAAVEGSE
jgi:poly(A) polymerase